MPAIVRAERYAAAVKAPSATHQEAPFQVFVEALDGATKVLCLSRESTVGDTKRKLHTSKNVPIDELMIVRGGVLLDDEALLRECVEDGATLRTCLRGRGGMEAQSSTGSDAASSYRAPEDDAASGAAPQHGAPAAPTANGANGAAPQQRQLVTVADRDVTTRHAKLTVVCKSKEEAARMAEDPIAIGVLQCLENKLNVIEAARRIYGGLTPAARSKTLGEALDQGEITPALLDGLHHFGTRDTLVGDLLLALQKGSVIELQNLAALTGAAAVVMKGLKSNEPRVQALIDQIDVKMRVHPENSPEQDAMWTSKHVTNWRQKIEKKVTTGGVKLKQAIDRITVDAPSVLNMLQAIHCTTVDLPEDSVAEIITFRQAEEKLIADRMLICTEEEKLSKLQCRVEFARQELAVLESLTAARIGLLQVETERLREEKVALEAEQFQPAPVPTSVEGRIAELEARLAGVTAELAEHCSRAPGAFVPPEVAAPDLSAHDKRVTAASKKLQDALDHPETTRVTTRRHSFLGLWTWHTEVTSSSEEDRGRQRAKLENIENVRNQALAAKRAALDAHRHEVETRTDIAKRQHEGAVHEHEQRKRQLKADEEELSTALEDTRARGEEAVRAFAQAEEDRRINFEARKAERVAVKVAAIQDVLDREKAAHAAKLAQAEAIRQAIDRAPDAIKSLEETITQAYDKWNRDGLNLKKRKDRIQGALDMVAGSEQTLHMVLDEIRAANASVVAPGMATASIRPLLDEYVQLTGPFDECDCGDYFSFRDTLEDRADIFNRLSNSGGLALLDPSVVRIDLNSPGAGAGVQQMLSGDGRAQVVCEARSVLPPPCE